MASENDPVKTDVDTKEISSSNMSNIGYHSPNIGSTTQLTTRSSEVQDILAIKKMTDALELKPEQKLKGRPTESNNWSDFHYHMRTRFDVGLLVKWLTGPSFIRMLWVRFPPTTGLGMKALPS
jgi:hypothetical protein